MNQRESTYKRIRYLLPRLMLWSICLAYLLITLGVALDLYPDYYYPLAYLRKTDPFALLGW